MSTSIAGKIGDALKTALEALKLAPVVRRKLPTLPAGKDPTEIVVSIGEEGDTDYLDFEGSVLVSYPCAVTVVRGAGGRKLADDDTWRLWREQIRQAADDDTTYTSVTGFHRVVSSGKAPFDPAALDKDLDYGIQVFTVWTLESRT